MYLSVKQVAELFNVSELTVYKWAKEKKIPSFKVGGLIRFDESHITAHIKGENAK